MATRCIIAMQEGDKVVNTYCHWDGYINGVGKTLYNHYNTAEAVANVVNTGPYSYLDADNLQEGTVIARRNDANDPAYTAESGYNVADFPPVDDVTELIDLYGSEYVYYFDGYNWQVYTSEGYTDLGSACFQQWYKNEYPKMREVIQQGTDGVPQKHFAMQEG